MADESTPQIMTPKHPRWPDFVERLAGPEGCDFNQPDGNNPTFRCNSDISKPFSSAILNSMGGIDIEGSLRYFESCGGFCDCEVLFNVKGDQG